MGTLLTPLVHGRLEFFGLFGSERAGYCCHASTHCLWIVLGPGICMLPADSVRDTVLLEPKAGLICFLQQASKLAVVGDMDSLRNVAHKSFLRHCNDYITVAKLSSVHEL